MLLIRLRTSAQPPSFFKGCVESGVDVFFSVFPALPSSSVSFDAFRSWLSFFYRCKRQQNMGLTRERGKPS